MTQPEESSETTTEVTFDLGPEGPEGGRPAPHQEANPDEDGVKVVVTLTVPSEDAALALTGELVACLSTDVPSVPHTVLRNVRGWAIGRGRPDDDGDEPPAPSGPAH